MAARVDVPKGARPTRFVAFAAILAIAGLSAGLVAGEIWVRVYPPNPIVQLVRGFGLHDLDGTPVWEESPTRQHTACVEKNPNRERILFVGSSITYGVMLKPEEVFTAILEKRLNALRPDPGVCVLNFAQPAFGFGQKLALERWAGTRYRPSIILWEHWNDLGRYVRAGDAAVNVADYETRADGFPAIDGMPDLLNHFLFRTSHLFQYLTLAEGRPAERHYEGEEYDGFLRDRVPEAVGVARSVNAEPIFFASPPLDHPFTDSPPANVVKDEAALDAATRATGSSAIFLRRELVHEDYTAIRLDPCCHFNAAGHRALEPIFERLLLGRIGRPSPVR